MEEDKRLVDITQKLISRITKEPIYTDPTYRISKLAAASNKPVSVAPDQSLQTATTLMLTHDFSQLPVMTSDYDVKGIITWKSIGIRLALGTKGSCVREFMEHHQEIPAAFSLINAIPIIVQSQYVLIRGQGRITGIVTASDLSLQFQQLAEPFLLLGEIENHIRLIIGDKFSPAELSDIRDSEDSNREVNSIYDLTFGQYIRLLQNPDKWMKINLSIDRVAFCDQLDTVRKIRNDVMHFNPDPMKAEDLQLLRDFLSFLQLLQNIAVP
jgi:predicted transcriptional regulator